MTAAVKVLSVAAIRNGTVIDHIEAGKALKIVRFLNLASHNAQVTLGLNLPSTALQYKDIIKVENRELSIDEANQVAILAPDATINIIKDFEVFRKFKVDLPEAIENVISCPNPCCISNHEKTGGRLRVIRKAKLKICLECHYCKKIFTQEEFR